MASPKNYVDFQYIKEKEVPWGVSLALGHIPYANHIYKFGENPTITVATSPEDVWQQGGVEVVETTAQTYSFVSTSPLDTAAGTGAQALTIEGLNGDYDFVKEEIELNGVTPVITSRIYLRIFRSFISRSGATLTNQGLISGTSSVTLNPHISIPAGVGQSLKSQFTIPRNKVGLMMNFNFGSLNNDQVEGRVQTRDFGPGGFRTRALIKFVEQNVIFPFTVPIFLDEKTDIRFQATQAAGAGSVGVSASYELIMFNKEIANFNNLIL